MATMKEIADLAGVSRGTVDRVLNKRGSVNSETAKRINELAQSLNYKPNQIGKKLAVKKKKLKFGYILFSSSASNPFFEDVEKGIRSKRTELKEYGIAVDVKYSSVDSPNLQVEIIDEMVRYGVKGIAMTPIYSELVRAKILEVTKKGIPVVTVNSDLPNSGRIAYVGSDYYKSGEVAAGFFGKVTSPKANAGIIIGSQSILCHSERVIAFKKHISEKYPQVNIIATAYNNDDNDESYVQTYAMMKKNPEIDSLFLAAGGVEGACRALKELGLGGEIKIVCFDTPSATKEFMKQDLILGAITQEPFVQGAKPLEILLDYVGLGIKPSKEIYYTDLGIRIKENL